MGNKVAKFNDYLIMWVLIAVSGFYVVLSSLVFESLTFFLFFLYFLYKKKKFNYTFILLIVGISALVFIQGIRFEEFSIKTLFGEVLVVSTAFFAVAILNVNFFRIYSRVMYFIVLVSLPIFLLINIVPNLSELLINTFSMTSDNYGYLKVKHSIGIYTLFESDDIGRNHGPFWEAGVFGGYLTIAALFNYITYRDLKNKEFWVLLIGLLTTLSTTAYLAIFFVLAIIIKDKNKGLKSTLVHLMAIFTFLLVMFNSEHLASKIIKQVEYAKLLTIEESDNTQRFLSVMRDMKDFQGHELFGRGSNQETRFSDTTKHVVIRTNGFTDFVVKHGLLFSTALLISLVFSLRSIMKYHDFHRSIYVLLFLLMLLTLLQSEVYLDRALFWTFVFFSFKKKSIVKNIKTSHVMRKAEGVYYES